MVPKFNLKSSYVEIQNFQTTSNGETTKTKVLESQSAAPSISFNGLWSGIVLDCFMVLLEVGSFFNFLHQQVHFGGGHVHLVDGVHPSLLGFETFVVPPLIRNRLFGEFHCFPHIE